MAWPIFGQLWLGVGELRDTSDFIADGLHAWWSERQPLYADSTRTQFMKRLVGFADGCGLDQ
jgi:hypothetical protein